MSLEAKIETLTAALTENTAAYKAFLAGGGSAASTKAADAPKASTPKAAAKKAGPTREEVDVAARAYAKEHGKAAAKALIATHGGADLAGLPEANWGAFVADTKNPPAPAEDSEDGL